MTDPTPGTPETVRDRIVMAVEALLGTPNASIADVTAALTALRGPNNATLSTLLTEGQFDAQGQLQNGILLDIKEMLTDIKSAIGIPTGDATTTAIGYLAQIARQTLIAIGGMPPVLGVDDRGSAGSLLVDGKRWARWPTTPSGVTAVGSDQIDLTASDWSAWEVYVQTTAPAVYLNTATDSPNSWLPLVGTGQYRFGVDAQYSIIAYLRAAQRDFPINSCVEFNSQLVTINNGQYIRHCAVWPLSVAATTSDPLPTVYNARTVATGNYHLGRVRLIGGFARLLMFTGGTSFIAANISAPNTYTIPVETVSIYLDNLSNQAFSVEVCPPA